MSDRYEAELNIAIAEGLLSKDEAEALREQARRQGRRLLELLREQGRLSEASFASLNALVDESMNQRHGVTQGEVETPSMPEPPPGPPATAVALVRPADKDAPSFPVAAWERYAPLRFLGQGGMGRVFLARDPRLNRDVAIKFVRDDEGPELTRRFISEARSQARVSHERVCKVFEVGEVQGKSYIAMQYIEGRPLGALAPELTVEQKALVLRDAALGVHGVNTCPLLAPVKIQGCPLRRARAG